MEILRRAVNSIDAKRKQKRAGLMPKQRRTVGVLVGLLVVAGAPSAVAETYQDKGTASGYKSYASQTYSSSHVSGTAATGHGWSSGSYQHKATFGKVAADAKSAYKAFGDVVASHRYLRKLSGTASLVQTWTTHSSAQTVRVAPGKSRTNLVATVKWTPQYGESPNAIRTQTSICNDRNNLPDTCDRDVFTTLFSN